MGCLFMEFYKRRIVVVIVRLVFIPSLAVVIKAGYVAF